MNRGELIATTSRSQVTLIARSYRDYQQYSRFEIRKSNPPELRKGKREMGYKQMGVLI